jgi:hypothetical protein
MIQCDLLLDAGLQSLVLLPESNAYVKRESSYWAANVPLHPKCIIQPRTSEEVPRVVKVLAKADGLVALRSGGVTVWSLSCLNMWLQLTLGEMILPILH